MKSFLVHLASIAVMVHMTFGCSWHHGLAAASACSHTDSLSSCCVTVEPDSHDESGHDDHDYDAHEHADHDCDDESHDESSLSDSTFDRGDQDSDNNHFCCSDDGCNVIKVVKFKLTLFDSVTQYLGGAEASAILQSFSNRSTIELLLARCLDITPQFCTGKSRCTFTESRFGRWVVA